MSDDMTVPDLEIMAGAVEYSRWLLSHVEDHIGARILEIGAGIGNYTEFLTDRELVVCLEIHPLAIDRLRSRFDDRPNILVTRGDVADPGLRQLASHRFDTALCFNVLEHVLDDGQALRNVRGALEPGGWLLLIVPALPALMGSVDRALGHHRRYTKNDLARRVAAAGLAVERVHYINSLGVLGWFVNNRLLPRHAESPAQIKAFSRLVVPWLSVLERRIPPPVGLSLVCIAQKPPPPAG